MLTERVPRLFQPVVRHSSKEVYGSYCTVVFIAKTFSVSIRSSAQRDGCKEAMREPGSMNGIRSQHRI